MNIGVLGGSFDPIHNGHIRLAALAKYQFNLNNVLFIPLNKPWLNKNKTFANTHHRLKMCELAVKNYDSFDVSEVDINRGGVSYMIDTIKEIKETFGVKNNFYIILGDDNIKKIESWKNYKELIKETNFIVAPREENTNNTFENADYITMNKLDISSSMIRKNIQSKQNWDNLVPEIVKIYIQNNKLYK